MRRTVALAGMVAMAGMVVLAGCQPQPAGSRLPGQTVVDTSPTPGATSAAVIDSDRGRIWGALPASFPVPPGSQPAEAAEPASAAFDVGAGGGGPADIARFYADELEALAYTASVDGPLEDGAFIVEANRLYTPCAVVVRAAPLGGVNRLTIFYGAGCPFA